MKKLKVLVLFDSAGTPPYSQDFTEEFKQEDWLTESKVVENLKQLEHEVKALGVYDNVNLILQEVTANRPDVVFNLTEIFDGKARLDKNIPALLELLGIPYTGCSPVGLMVCNNKALTKKILTYHRIKTPHFHIFPKGKRIHNIKRLKFPLVIKPLQEEASTGITQSSFVDNEKDLPERVKFIHEKFDMDALAEEYVDGRELYASILGNKRLEAYPLREMKFTQVPDDEPKLATYKAKWDKAYREKWGIKNEFAGRLAEGANEKILDTCKKAYKILMLDGYARFDLRLTPQGEIYVIEANANPSLSIDDEFSESAKKAEVSYDQLIQKILNLAFQR